MTSRRRGRSSGRRGAALVAALAALALLMAIAVARALTARGTDREFVLAVVALISFGFFVVSALRHGIFHLN